MVIAPPTALSSRTRNLFNKFCTWQITQTQTIKEITDIGMNQNFTPQSKDYPQ